MSKAEEILSQFDVLYYDNFDLYVYSKEDVLKAMEAYGMACLEKAADKAKITETNLQLDDEDENCKKIRWYFENGEYNYTVNKASIISKENLA